ARRGSWGYQADERWQHPLEGDGMIYVNPCQSFHLYLFIEYCLGRAQRFFFFFFLNRQQIQNPTAIMIARTAVAQDETSGDGTTSTVLFIGELMKQSERYIDEGLLFSRPVDLFLFWLKSFALAERCVLCIRKPDEPIDLFMVEIMHMRHKFDVDTHLVGFSRLIFVFTFFLKVEGLVLDHGSRHPDMKRRAENCYILTCNVSLEYEKRLIFL
ncbi:hypothetical protein BHM03_00007659, partial [Ensete ventricosum]